MFNRRAHEPGSKPHGTACAAQEDETVERDEPAGAERVGHPGKPHRGGEAFAARFGTVAIGIHGCRRREERSSLGLAQEDLGEDARCR